MTYPQFTFELRIEFVDQTSTDEDDSNQCKSEVMEWLTNRGVDEFVEGALEGLDIDNEYTGPTDRDFYEEYGGSKLPISIYKYSKEFLDELEQELIRTFKGRIQTSVLGIETKVWLEGWKESFKPIESALCYIYPPWDEAPRPSTKIPIVIEPGMAFGTGQHATTRVCMGEIEKFAIQNKNELSSYRLLDVGTGTGVLAIAGKKLGFASVAGTDIDPDAILSAGGNVSANQVVMTLAQMSVPKEGKGLILDPTLKPPFDVVVCNILYVVLSKLFPDLARATTTNGTLIVSGLLVEDAEQMKNDARPLGLKLQTESSLEGWACLVFKKMG